MTLEREILCGNGQVKGWHLAAHEWITGKREIGLGVLTGTRLKMEDRCIRLPETWKNKVQRLFKIQVDDKFQNSFLGSHTKINMLDMISCKC